MIHKIFDLQGVPILVTLFLLLFLLERKLSLRKLYQPRFKRMVLNSVVSIPAFTLLRFIFLPIMVWLANENSQLQFGLNYLYSLPSWAEFLIAFLLLDYGNYLWHHLNHKVPFLWRYHLVHHTDPDLDITTAFRFHFGEMIGSVFFRGAVVFLSGASPLLVLMYEIIFEAATQFHHTNWKLPIKVERILNLLLVTPRMHGIHHSIVKEETDSNYAVILSCWDRIHNTIRLNVPQQLVTTGVPSYSEPGELTVSNLLKLPFQKQRPWGGRIKRADGEVDTQNKNKLSA
jgi:sterol desaturase/sphingolipid hydroxylase (fatty acid hydroxylase superfamily)